MECVVGKEGWERASETSGMRHDGICYGGLCMTRRCSGISWYHSTRFEVAYIEG